MKRVLILTVAILSSVVAFSQKIGHIDRAALIKSMPETADVEKRLADIQQEYVTAYQNFEQEYNTLIQEYQANEKTWPAAIKDSKIKAIQAKEQQLGEFEQSASTDVQAQQQTLYQPIIDKAAKAIEEVAKENGFTYIIDSGLGVLLYMGGEDILELTKKKLQIPATPPTPAPAPKK